MDDKLRHFEIRHTTHATIGMFFPRAKDSNRHFEPTPRKYRFEGPLKIELGEIE